MIYIIIGGTCCGKTSFVKNTWLKRKQFETKKDILWYVETEDAVLIGKYINIDGRERSGTDTISRSQIHIISEQVRRLSSYNKDIVLEGDKVTFRSVLDEIIGIMDVTLICITSNIDVIIDRYYKNCGKSSLSSVKASRTKSLNIYNEYKDKVNSRYIDTSYFAEEDFKNFNLWDIDEYTNKKDYTKILF